MTRLTAWDPFAHPPDLHPAYRSTMLRAPFKPRLQISAGPLELSKPIFDATKIRDMDANLIQNHAAPGEMAIGPRIIVHGQVIERGGRPVTGALIEIWQANAGGRYRHRRESYLAPLDPNFGGCGRTVTDEDGRYSFLTIQPGAYPWPNGPNDWRPAHIHFSIFGSCFAQRLVTQMYFQGDPMIDLCPIVASLPDRGAVERLTARLDMSTTKPFDARAYRFDIVLRGTLQTPFENRPEGM